MSKAQAVASAAVPPTPAAPAVDKAAPATVFDKAASAPNVYQAVLPLSPRVDTAAPAASTPTVAPAFAS